MDTTPAEPIKITWRGKMLALLLVASIALLLGEAVLQVHYRVRNQVWLWDDKPFQVDFVRTVADRRQYTLKPNIGEKAINRLGYRGALVPKDAQPVIIALGDSVPYGWGVPATESYPAQLQGMLTEAGSNIQVVNAGVPSYNLQQSFDRLRYEVLQTYHRPLLVTVQAANDITLLTYYRDQYAPHLTWGDAALKKQSWQGMRYTRCATLCYLRRAVAGARARAARKNGRIPAVPTPRMLTHEQSVLREGLAFCRARNIPVVLLPVDLYFYQTSHTERNAQLQAWRSGNLRSYYTLWGPIARQYNAQLQQAAQRERGVYFFDTRPLLDAGTREGMFVDHIHLSAAGNRIVARGLYDFLSEQQLISSPATRRQRSNGHE